MKAPSLYRGSLKHKNRPAAGRKGTLCPEWTHALSNSGFNGDPFQHEWNETIANQLFDQSKSDPATEKRYATSRGIAFVAQPTADGTWHGYPEPWNRVPAEIKDIWLSEGLVTRRDIKRYIDFSKEDVRWALDSDE